MHWTHIAGAEKNKTLALRQNLCYNERGIVRASSPTPHVDGTERGAVLTAARQRIYPESRRLP